MRDSSRVGEDAEKKVLVREGRLSRGELYRRAAGVQAKKAKRHGDVSTSKDVAYIGQREQTNSIGRVMHRFTNFPGLLRDSRGKNYDRELLSLT